MKKISIMILYISLIGTLSLGHNKTPTEIILEPIIVTQPSNDKSLNDFLRDMAERESNNNPTVVNRLGYLGKYQFSPKTLWGLGSDFKVTKIEFLNNEELQDSAMMAYLNRNYKILQDVIVKYGNTSHNGIQITESGILAGAHLVGPYGIRAYFDPAFTIERSGRQIRPRLQDANGTHVEEYLEQFSNYELDLAS